MALEKTGAETEFSAMTTYRLRTVAQIELHSTRQCRAVLLHTEDTGRLRLSQAVRQPAAAVCCIQGRLALYDRKHVCIAAAGETLLVRPPAEYVLYAQCGRMKAVLLGTDPARVPALAVPEEPLLLDTPLLCGRGAPHPNSEEAVQQLLSALAAAKPAAHGFTCPPSQLRLAFLAYAQLAGNPGAHILIEQLAADLQISPTHLKNSFRLVYGDSIYSYIRTQKMLLAAQALRGSSRTVLDIAGDFGYDNGSKFARAFQHVLGVTPREFRSNPELPLVSIDGLCLHAPFPEDEI